MKAKITVEEYDNGIAIKWSNPDGEEERIVALDCDKEKELGKMILDDIKYIMNTELSTVVTMNIDYENTKEERVGDIGRLAQKIV